MSTDVHGNLPLKDNWRYRPYDVTTFILTPGESRVIVDLRRKGWVVAGFLTHNNPDMKLTIELETGTETYVNTFTTNELYQLGLVQAQVNGWWVSRYDSISNIYNVILTPASWLPFYRRLKVILENKTTRNATITRFAAVCIEFVEVVK